MKLDSPAYSLLLFLEEVNKRVDPKDKDLESRLSALDQRLKGMLAKTSTFVSIDVEDSTGIKMGESEEDVIFSFLAYQKLVELAIGQHSGQVVSITGDGVMAKFAVAQDAVESGLHLLSRLPEFNKSVNLLKSPIKIRVGINTGKVFEDAEEQSKSQQLLPSQAIDLAGYLQKRAPSNGMWISQFTVEQMAQLPPVVVKGHYDDKLGFAVYIYRSEGPAAGSRRSQGVKPKVLIVEDEPDQAFELARVFADEGYETQVAFDGVDGLIRYRVFNPDLILLDIGLPRLDGWHVLEELKRNKLATKAPVLMLARRYKIADIEWSFEMGASGCVRKPCDAQKLLRKAQLLVG